MISERLARLRWSLFVPSPPFDDERLEARFISEFRSVGRIFAIYGFSLGIVLAAFAFLIMRLGLAGYPEDAFTQNARLSTIAILLVVILVLRFAPEFAIHNFNLIVGAGLASAVWLIGIMSIWLAYARPGEPAKLLVALVIASWIGYGFMRLSLVFIASIVFIGSSLVYYAAVIVEPQQRYGILMYLVVINLVGWVLSVQIERRERKLFEQSSRLSELGQALETRMLELVRSSEEKQDVLHGVAHDLRQPLLSLDLNLAMLRANHFQDLSECYDALGLAINQMQRGIERILRDANSQGQVNELEYVDLEAIARDSISLLRAEATVVKVCLKWRKIGSGNLVVRSDAVALRAIFQNLIGNAIKFQRAKAGTNRVVLVSAANITGSVRIDIWDSGVGMSAEEIENAFEPYWRGRNHGRHQTIGLGLGLSVVKNLCLQLPSHTVELDSVLGKGTRVRIRIKSQCGK